MMNPFKIANARSMTIEEIIRFDTGRQKQRELVSNAILDSSHNVYIYGSKGSGKTFFQKTQAYYFEQLDENIFPLYLPCDFHKFYNPEDLTLHVLNTIMLACWSKFFNRQQSDLIHLSALDEHSILDDLKPIQKKYIRLYNLIHIQQFDITHKKNFLFGASAIAKTENKYENGQSYSREKLSPAELFVIVNELAEIISESNINKIVIHLDEIEIISTSQLENMLSMSLGMFNPIGIQFIVTGTPLESYKSGESILSNIETAIELEGLASMKELGEMISKYSYGSKYSFNDESISILYEFFRGHPRSSIISCNNAVNLSEFTKDPITPQLTTRACLQVQKEIEEWKIHFNTKR